MPSPLREATYPIAPRGYATSFEESELPIQYSLSFKNRFINAAGGAEKRQGIRQLGDDVGGTPNLTDLHELVDASGAATLFTSGAGVIYSFDGSSAYSSVHSGLDSNARIQSVQMGSRLIFVNGVDWPVYTEDGITFRRLKAIIRDGDCTAGTDANELVDSQVENWITDTQTTQNDLVFNINKAAYGVITAVATATVTHTEISLVGTGLGQAAASAATGDKYEILDAVALNVIPVSGGDKDNVATAGSGTGATTIAVSGFSFVGSDVVAGDFIRNTTRSAVAMVSAVATALTVTSVASQAQNDSLVFLKHAVPIASRAHVHFGRLYQIDSRDKRLVRISGPDDPQDYSTDSGTIDSSSFRFGNQQPQGDFAVDMGSFAQFFVIAGKKNLYLYSGTNPIADTAGDAPDFSPKGLFPQGQVAPNAGVSIGNDFIFISPDGAQSVSQVDDASTLNRAHLSEAIRTTLRDELERASDDEIFAFHYPRRSWFCLKISSQMYVFNYTPYFSQEHLALRASGDVKERSGSWHLFDGKFARQNAYFLRQNGDLICCGDGGKVYIFDQGDFDDDGETYTTEYQTGWLTLDEPKKSTKTKAGKYIRPLFNAGSNIVYTIRAEAGFSVDSTESITIIASGGATPIGLAVIGSAVIGGSSVQDIRHPLRWRGREVRLTFMTDDNKGPDIIARFTLYVSQHGKN